MEKNSRTKKHHACKHDPKVHECFDKYRGKHFLLPVLGLISLAWFLVRTGTKPTRAVYPCQQTALANSIAFVPGLYPLLLVGSKAASKMNNKWTLGALVAALIVILISAAGNEYLRQRSWAQMTSNQPIGTPAGVSPGRVVWTHDAEATSGNYSSYWTQIDQSKVDNMMEMSLKALAGEQSGAAAVAKLFPCGADCTGKKIAIKVNFNNSGRGADQMDSNGQTVNALLKYLTTPAQGVFQPFNQADIYIYDASRTIRSAFSSQIKSSFPNARLFSEGDIVNSSENYVFDPNYCQPSAAHKVPEIIKNADYLIDMPILKAHGNAGVTLTFKNHFGSATDPVSFHPCIDRDMKFLVGMYTAGFKNADNSPTTIAQKTKLIVGDALYGNYHGPNNPPENWSIFKNDSPNSLFVSQDPVAVDSVMFDLLMQQIGSFNSAKQIYLEEAANRAGGSLGVHEHPGLKQGCGDLKDLNCWNYTKLDFVACDISSNKLNPLCSGSGIAPQPTNIVPTFVCAGGVNCAPSTSPTPVITSGYIQPSTTGVNPSPNQNTAVTPATNAAGTPALSVTVSSAINQPITQPNNNAGQNQDQNNLPQPGDKTNNGNNSLNGNNGLILKLLELIKMILQLLASLLKL